MATGLKTGTAWGRLVMCVLPLVGCGAEDIVDDIVTPQPVRTVIGTESFTNLASGHGVHGGLQIGLSGVLDVTAQWGSAANDLDVYLTSTNCGSTADLVAGRCLVWASSRTRAKPERFTYEVMAGSYEVWVVNFGPGPETGMLEVGITR